jgi:hypothetical protein
MTSTKPSTSPIVKVQFGSLDRFCEELAARGPNVEPVVRICQQVRAGQSDTHGPLLVEHVFGHASYLRQTADALHLTVLHLYLGQRWIHATNTPDRAELHARVDERYDRVRSTRQALGLTLVDGSAYQEPTARP